MFSSKPRSTSSTRTDTRADGGFTMIEVLVVMVMLVVVGGMAAKFYGGLNHNTVISTGRDAATSQLQDASTSLSRDVGEAEVITTADNTKLVLLVQRADVCNRRTYTVVGGKLQVQTDFFAQATCAGPTTTKTTTLVDQFTVTAPFSFIDHNLVTLSTPVTEIRGVTGVGWHLARAVAGTVNGVSRDAASPYSGKNLAAGNGVAAARALAPLLSVVTNDTGLEGRDQPVLRWVDESPSVTKSWKIWRAAWPEGGTQANWALLFTILDPTVATFTDTSLPAGWTAQYEVQPTVGTNTETPMSNIVTTGLRAPTPTGVTATGAPTSITVAWAQTVGATGYDVYRDGSLLAHLGNVVSYTDSTGYGHSHQYALVGWNRWEGLILGGTQTSQAAIGDATAQAYRGGTQRLASASSGAFTAPAAPTLSAVARSDWSNTLAWTAAGWTGTGPTSLGGVSRDRGWVYATDGSTGPTPSGSWTAWSSEYAAAAPTRVVAYSQATVAGQYRSYEARTCNAVGCSPASAPVTILQRPTNPGSCTAVLGGITTRQATVTVARPAQVAAYTSSEVTGGTPASGFTVVGTGQANTATFAIDNLAHSTTHTFTVRNQNASGANGGWSDTSTCQVTTAVLGVSIPSYSSTTRSITATGAATNGTSQSITLQGIATYNNTLAGFWDKIADGGNYMVTADNTDGINVVSASQAISTPALSYPVPTCSANMTDGTAPGAIVVSGGNQVKLGGGGTVYGSPQTFSSLGAGTYTGYARNEATDGYNTHWSAWDPCPSRTIINPVPATPTGFQSARVLRIISASDLSYMGMEMQATWSPVAGATTYEVKFAWTNSGGPQTRTITASSPAILDDLDNSDIPTVQAYIRAGNGSGWSAWYGPASLTSGGQLSW